MGFVWYGFIAILLWISVRLAKRYYLIFTRPKEKDGKRLIYWDQLPGNKNYFLIGDLLEARKYSHDLIQLWKYRYQKFGKIFGSTFLDRRFMGITDPDLIEHILKGNFPSFGKGENFHQQFEPLLGDGIFNVDGPLWKKQRATASHLFSVKELKYMSEVFVRHAQLVIEILEEKRKSGESIEMQDLFQKYTLDSFGEIALGTSIDSLHKEAPFAQSFDEANGLIIRRLFNPLWKYFPWIENEVNLRKHTKEIDNFVYGVIEQRKNDKTTKDRQDLLSRYMSMTEEDGTNFSDRYLRDIILNFTLAGRDTTSILLTITFYLLAKHPEKEQKLRQEIHQFFPNCEIPTFDALKQLEYMKAVLNETLRLYPPVPLNNKTSLTDDILPNGVVVQKNTRIGYSTYMLGRLEEYWDCPDEFRPERWLGENGGKPINQKAFIPFSIGPRLCLGKEMAYLEAKIMVVMVMQKYSLKLVNKDQELKITPAATLKLGNDLSVFVTNI